MFTPLKEIPQGKNWTLEELNDREVQLLIPVIVFVSICMVVGTIGNALVLYVNIIALKRHNSTHRYCITFLAVVDITFCVIGDPFVLGVLTHPYTYTNTLACKSLRAFTYFNAMVSIFVLFVIAIDRYRKICKPYGKQLSIRSMKYIFGFIGVLSFILSIPCFILYGKNTVQTGVANITGIQCFPDDMYKDTFFPNGYIMFLYSFYIIVTALMSLFYIMVWRQIRKHSHLMGTKYTADVKETNVYSCSSDTYSAQMNSATTVHEVQQNKLEDQKRTDDPRQNTNEGNKGNMDKKHNVRAKTIHVSKILFVVTVFFVLSFTPFLTLELMTFFDEEYIENLDNTSTMVYQLFWRTFAINFMVNPFIYGAMDMKFQMECKMLVLKILHL